MSLENPVLNRSIKSFVAIDKLNFFLLRLFRKA